MAERPTSPQGGQAGHWLCSWWVWSQRLGVLGHRLPRGDVPCAVGELGRTQDPAQRTLLAGAGPAARVAAVRLPQPWAHSGRAPAERGARGQGPGGRVEAQGASPAELGGGDSEQAARTAQRPGRGPEPGGRLQGQRQCPGVRRGPAAACLLAVPGSAPEQLAGIGSPQALVVSGSGERGAGEAGLEVEGLGGLQPGGARPRLQSPRALRHITTALYRATDKHRSQVSTATAPCWGGSERTAGLQTHPRAGYCYSRAGGWGLGLPAQLGLGPQDRA